MSAEIIDGKQIAEEIRRELRAEIERLSGNHGLTPGLLHPRSWGIIRPSVIVRDGQESGLPGFGNEVFPPPFAGRDDLAEYLLGC